MIGDDKLVSLLGEWTGEERLFTTPWTAAGTAQGRLVLTRAPRHGLLMDYAQRRDGVLALEGHGVMHENGWWWFDSYGFTPDGPGEARWEDATLVLERSSERGRTLVRLRRAGPVLCHEIATAIPAGGELMPLLEARYRPR